MKHAEITQFFPFAHRNQIPVCLWGPTGIGKTEAVEQYAERIGAELVILHLASQEPGDLVGLPGRENMTVEEQKIAIEEGMKNKSGRTVWLRPEWMHDENAKGKYIYFLDELNRAPKYVINAMFSFILNGTIHTHTLPKDAWVLAAANPAGGDDYDVTELHDKAFISRLCHIVLRPTSEEWIQYTQDKIHTAVHTAVAKMPEVLGFDTIDLGFEATPDARSIMLMGQALNNITGTEFGRFGFEYMKGCVGQSLATAINKQWKDRLESINPQDVLDKYPKIRQDVLAFANTKNARLDILNGCNIQLVALLKKEEKLKGTPLKNLLRYLKDIPRDVAQSVLITFASDSEEGTCFKQIMTDLGKDDDLYQMMLEVTDPEANRKKSKEDKEEEEK